MHVNKNRGVQKGFTLIELIIVIVILGVLAAVAIPNYIDLKTDAQAAALSGVAGGMAAAMANNFAIRSAYPTKGTAVTTCSGVSALLNAGTPSGYTVSSTSIANGASASCTVTQTATSSSTTFVGLGIN